MRTLAYGLGVDSTAMLVGLIEREIPLDYVLFADTGAEKQQTYDYLPIINAYLRDWGYPLVTIVRYQPKDFKNWPPYATLEQNCLTNGTLPSLAFGFSSCSQKWKAAPQEAYLKAQPDVQAEWAAGRPIEKLIGYDASPADLKRRHHAGDQNDQRYAYRYPLIEWGWTRERCIEEIRKAGLPVPQKSSCIFCPAMKPAEVDQLAPADLRRIVVLEARAKPRLEKIEGLWRNGCKGTRGATPKPGSMTQYIVSQGLLPADHVEWIQAQVPQAVVAWQARHAKGERLLSWPIFFSLLEERAPWNQPAALAA